MVGNSLNSDTLRSLEVWFCRSIEEWDGQLFKTLHVSDLGEFTKERETIIEYSAALTECLYDLCERSSILSKVYPLLVVPLLCSSSLRQWDLTEKEIEKEISDEPPSIYLISREYGKFFEEVEEYRYFFNSRYKNDHCLTYYKTFRKKEEISRGWEYSRCFYLEYCGKEFIT